MKLMSGDLLNFLNNFFDFSTLKTKIVNLKPSDDETVINSEWIDNENLRSRRKGRSISDREEY